MATSPSRPGADAAQDFAAEVDRLRAARFPGVGGRLRDLFDFLADRGDAAEPATQAEIAARVFGQAEPDADDATVRVYVHRLRKRLEEHYAQTANGARARLEIPPGIYGLRFAAGRAPGGAIAAPRDLENASKRNVRRLWPLALVLALFVGLAAGWALTRVRQPPVNSLWSPFLVSERPVLIVLGDYYIYGEIDPLRPEEGRLIRDFRVNSPADLQRMRDLEPERFAVAEDVGLNYLPFSAAYGLGAVMPLMEAQGKEVTLIAASQLAPDMLNRFDVVYVGLLSGMGLLEELNLMGSGFVSGESYDELIDLASGRSFVSGEARSLTSQAYYRDYAYLARFHAPSGALVAVLGGSRDTGLRALGAIVASPDLPPDLAATARDHDGFEALYEITGQQGADLSERLVVARARAAGEP